MGDAVVGIIGMGDMGKMYARRISDAGWKYVQASLLCLAELVMVRVYIFFLSPHSCTDDLSAFGSSIVAMAPATTVLVRLTRRLSLM